MIISWWMVKRPWQCFITKANIVVLYFLLIFFTTVLGGLVFLPIYHFKIIFLVDSILHAV